jgi:hypothetical protein
MTRSNTLIHDGKTSTIITLYRHCDGYLSGAGVDAYKMMKELMATNAAIRGSLTAEDVAQWFIRNGDGEYEETSGIHGDVEYIYDVYINFKYSHTDGIPFKIRAFTTKMHLGKGPATRDEDVTDKLDKEIEQSLGQKPSSGTDDERDIAAVYEKIGEAVDKIWKGSLRDQMIDAVMDVVDASKENGR